MTVAELIERLKEFLPNRNVYLDTGLHGNQICRTGTIYTAYIVQPGTQWFPAKYETEATDQRNSPVVMISL